MMLRKAALSVLLVLLIVSSTTTLVAATSLTIPVVPLSSEMRSLPIKVYWMDSGVCSQEERDAMKEALDIALGILAGGASKLESEYSDKFSGFSSFKFVKVSDAGSAQIIVTDADLGIIGGRAVLTSSGGKIVPPSRVEISCDAVSAGADVLISIVLHELGHALGLGHTSFSEYNGIDELMYPVGTSTTLVYPSTLDFYAIYQLVIKGYEGDSVSLPDWLPYGQVTPQRLILPEEEEGGGETVEQTATLEELERKYEDLKKKYDSLSNVVADLGNDVQTIEERLDDLEHRMDQLEENVDALENKTTNLEEKLNATENTLINHTQQIEWLNESLSRVNKSLSQLDIFGEQLDQIEENIENLSLNLDELIQQMNYTQYEWLSNFSNITKKQKLLEEMMKDQRSQFSEKISGISQQLDDTRSDVDELKSKVTELEKQLEARELEIMRLRRCSLIFFILLIISITLAAVGLSRASKAKKAVSPPKTEDTQSKS